MGFFFGQPSEDSSGQVSVAAEPPPTAPVSLDRGGVLTSAVTANINDYDGANGPGVDFADPPIINRGTFGVQQRFTSVPFPRSSQIRQPLSTRLIVYGETRTSGPLFFLATTEDEAKLHLVIGLAAHEVDAIGTVFINNEPVYASNLDADGNATAGKFSGKVRIKKHLGGADQLADTDLVADIAEWTTEHRLRGIAYLYLRFAADRNLFAGAVPAVAAMVRGRKVFDPRVSETVWSNNPALCLRDYLTDPTVGLGAAATEIDDVFTNAAANICDEAVDTKTVAVTVDAVDFANDEIDLDEERLSFQTGDRVQIGTDGTLPAGLAAATDYYVAVARERGTDDVKPAVHLATDLANARAGTAVTIADAGTGTHTLTKTGEMRFAVDGLVGTHVAPEENIRLMLEAMGGELVYVGGQWNMSPAVYVPPVVSFSEGDLRAGTFKVQTALSLRDAFNTVKGLFISPAHDWQPTDFPQVTNATFVAADNGETLPLDVEFPFTARGAMAQRLAKIALMRGRQEISVQMSCNLTATRVQAGDTVMISNQTFGWTDKIFEVVEWGMSTFNVAGGAPMAGIDLKLREIAASDFDFDPATEETIIDPAPNTNLPDPFDLAPPSGLALTSGNTELFVKADGTIISRLKASWTASPNPFVDRYDVEFRRVGAPAFQAAASPGVNTETFIWEVEDGADYEVRVRAINGIGVASVWVTDTHVVAGKTAPPPDVLEFDVFRHTDGTRRFTWEESNPPADLAGFAIRQSQDLNAAWENMTPLHSGLLAHSPFETNELAAGTYLFTIKMVDSSGNESVSGPSILSALGDPRLGEVLFRQDEAIVGWPGTVQSGCLLETVFGLAGPIAIADLPPTIAELGPTLAIMAGTAITAIIAGAAVDIDALPATIDELSDSIDTFAGHQSPIAYTSETIDLGFDATFTPLVTVDGSGAPLIEMQTGLDADGDVVGMFVPAAQVKARFVKFRSSMADAVDAPTIVRIVTLLDGDALTECFENVVTATHSAPWFERVGPGHFKMASRTSGLAAISQARILALQDVGPGFSWVLDSKSDMVAGAPAAAFKIFDAGGLPADATVDIELKGPKV